MSEPGTAPRLDRSLPLADRVRERAERIDRIGSSHSNTARALAKDSLRLLEALEDIARHDGITEPTYRNPWLKAQEALDA